MPIKESAKKYMRSSEEKRSYNQKRKKDFRKTAKEIQQLAKDGEKGKAEEIYKKFQKAVDKAVKSKTIKKNTAIRKKSRMCKMIKKIAK